MSGLDPRTRLTEGVTRARLLQESRRSLRPLVALIVSGLFLLGGVAYIVLHLSTTFGQGTREVHFALREVKGVVPGLADLRYRGLRAGKITKLERRDGQIVATATIAKQYGVIYRDAKAELRPATPLQDIYLDIVDPGTPRAGDLGTGVLPSTSTDTPVDIDDVLSVFRANEQTRMRELVDNLGNGLADRGHDLRAAIVQTTPLLLEAVRVTDALSRKREATKRLVHNAAILTTALGQRDVQLRTLVREGAATFGTLQAGSRDVERTLAELAPTFETINSSFTSVRGVLGDLDTAVSDLYPVADRLPAALTSVRKLSGSLGPAVRAVRTPVQRLVPFSRLLPGLANDVRLTTDALQSQIPAYDKTTQTLADCERGVTGFFQWNASLTKFADVRGPVPRGNLVIGAPDTGAVQEPKRTPGGNCTGGTTISGRPVQPEDGN